jgi:hypothetical protein
MAKMHIDDFRVLEKHLSEGLSRLIPEVVVAQIQHIELSLLLDYELRQFFNLGVFQHIMTQIEIHYVRVTL